MQKELPIGWTKTKLGDICTKPQYGWTTQSDISGDFKYLRTTDISKGKIDWDRMPYCIDVPEDKEKYLLGKDDIVVSRAGSVGLSYRITDTPQPTLFASYLIRFKPIKVFPKIVEYYLKSDMYWKAISEMSAGIAVQNVNAVKLSDLDFPLPPLPTQQRMVAKLDTLFEHLDALKNRFDRIPQLLKDFRQKVLTQAVTGKLTEGWREGKELEDIKILFSKIDFRRNQHKKSKISNLKLDLRSDLDLFELPSKWAWADLNFLMDEENSFCYGVVQPGKDVKNEQKLIRVQDLSNGKILNDQLRGISWKIDKEYTRSKVNEGDLLVTVVGTIGRTAIVAKESVGLNIARAVAKIPIRDCNGHYIRIFFDSEIGQQWLVGDAREVARKTLNLDQLKTLPIAVPPVEEQQEIVRRVESLFAKADQIEASYQKLTAKIEQLPQALLAKAFRGELVEQLPTDGDARQLLEEIRKAKTGLEKGGKIKKMKGDEETRMVAEGGSRYGLRRI